MTGNIQSSIKTSNLALCRRSVPLHEGGSVKSPASAVFSPEMRVATPKVPRGSRLGLLFGPALRFRLLGTNPNNSACIPAKSFLEMLV